MMLCLKFIQLILLIAAPDLLFADETVTTCDGDVQRISCSTGLIRVGVTMYGRLDSDICPPLRSHLMTTNTNCYSTVTAIANRCNGLSKCEVKTDEIDAPDPCRGTYKYFTTTFECINGRDVAVCERGYHTLDCGLNTIDIINANFGRADSTTCSNGIQNGLTEKTNCFAPNVFSNIKNMCNGQTSCTVQASSTHNFMSSCKQTAKYLTVSYRCLTQVITCEGSAVDLTCGDLKLEIVSTDYGRSDGTTCSANRPVHQLANRNCRAPNALNKVRSRCDDQRTCSVPATNAFFTDPCINTYKYLTIVFTCI